MRAAFWATEWLPLSLSHGFDWIMPDLPSTTHPNPPPADWNPAKPEVIPEPSVWPPALALAITLLLWGLVTSLIITGVGIVLFIISIVGWIGDIRHERRTH